MEQKTLNTHLHQHLGDARKYLEHYKKFERTEDLHKMRVAIKKLKALHSFSSKVNNTSHSNEELNRLFKPAGRLRELSLHISKLRKLKGVPRNVISILKKEMLRQKTHFLKNTPRYRNNLKRYELRQSEGPSFSTPKNIKLYFKDKFRAAKKDLDKEKRKAMHHFRKQIKQMMYVYQTLPKATQKKLKLKSNKIDRIQDQVGKWHDTNAFIQFLSKRSFATDLEPVINDLKKKEKKQFKKCLRLKL